MNNDHLNSYRLLQSYQTDDTKELVYKKMMLDFIEASDDCFLRSCTMGHITASAFLMNKDLSKVLLMHHAKLDKWMQLGGHCDGCSDILAVAIKEAQEESGIHQIRALSDEIFDIDIHLIPANAKESAHYHFDIRFLLQAYDNDTVSQNHESKALAWVNKSSLNLPTNSESVTRMFKKLNSPQYQYLFEKTALV